MRTSHWVFAMMVGAFVLAAPAGVRAAGEDHPAVKELTRRGVLMNYPVGKFQPDKPVTRLELAIVLARLLRAIESNPSAAQPASKPKPAAKTPQNQRVLASVPQWARTEVAFLADRGYPAMQPALCCDWSKPVRQKDLTAALTWALSSLAKRGYIPAGDLAAPPAEPEPKK